MITETMLCVGVDGCARDNRVVQTFRLKLDVEARPTRFNKLVIPLSTRTSS